MVKKRYNISKKINEIQKKNLIFSTQNKKELKISHTFFNDEIERKIDGFLKAFYASYCCLNKKPKEF